MYIQTGVDMLLPMLVKEYITQFSEAIQLIHANFNPLFYIDKEKFNPFCSILQTDSYQATGCYNLLCAGFVQTNSRIAIGAAISPVSSFLSNQYDITILIWKVHIHHFHFFFPTFSNAKLYATICWTGWP